MADLVDILEGNAIPVKHIIHDCVSDGADDIVMTGASTYTFVCNCATRDYKSVTGTSLWDSATSTITDGLLNTKIDLKIRFALNSTVLERSCVFEIYIPHSGGDISVDSQSVFIDSKNNDISISLSSFFYISQEALDFGFKIRMTPEVDMTIKNTSILVVE